MDQVSVAHGLLEIARKRTATATTELRVVAQKRQKCADKLKLQTDTASQIATDKKPKLIDYQHFFNSLVFYWHSDTDSTCD